jgi:hypothetical protein
MIFGIVCQEIGTQSPLTASTTGAIQKSSKSDFLSSYHLVEELYALIDELHLEKWEFPFGSPKSWMPSASV